MREIDKHFPPPIVHLQITRYDEVRVAACGVSWVSTDGKDSTSVIEHVTCKDCRRHYYAN